VELPNGTVLIAPQTLPGIASEAAAVGLALDRPIQGPPLQRFVQRRSRVGIVICDITRPFPARRVLPALIERLGESEITLFVATGTHRRCTDSELLVMLGPDLISRCRIVQHDAFDRARHVEIGRLSGTGTPALIESEFLQQDVRITTGFIEPHFFAGFSGGPKMVAPGLASIETVLDLHSARRIGDAAARWGVTFGNPVHDGVREIAALAKVDFNLDVTLNHRYEITAVFAGGLDASHLAGCQFARRTAMAPVDRLFDIVVTTNNGYPLDQNLYQSVKGMSAAAQIVRDGGTIVVASECSDGLPQHGRYKDLLRESDGPASFLHRLAQVGFSSHDQWQVQIQALIQTRARVFVKARGLTNDELRAAWVEPIDDVEELVAKIGGSVAALPYGPLTIPYLAS
jgi:lactate racemase